MTHSYEKDDAAYPTKEALLLPALSLFTSLGTLVCCALPALFVTLGAGATLASVVSTVPWLVKLSTYKTWTFGISGMMLLLAGIMQWNSRYLPCPTDPQQARACTNIRLLTRWIYWVSAITWSVGFFFAFIAAHVFF